VPFIGRDIIALWKFCGTRLSAVITCQRAPHSITSIKTITYKRAASSGGRAGSSNLLTPTNLASDWTRKSYLSPKVTPFCRSSQSARQGATSRNIQYNDDGHTFTHTAIHILEKSKCHKLALAPLAVSSYHDYLLATSFFCPGKQYCLDRRLTKFDLLPP
jgi:hypothetical protein